MKAGAKKDGCCGKCEGHAKADGKGCCGGKCEMKAGAGKDGCCDKCDLHASAAKAAAGYACPMHPEVKGTATDRCTKCGMALRATQPEKK
jgi:hypothetical protein